MPLTDFTGTIMADSVNLMPQKSSGKSENKLF
jgi:hypothetical protein